MKTVARNREKKLGKGVYIFFLSFFNMSHSHYAITEGGGGKGRALKDNGDTRYRLWSISKFILCPSKKC